MIWADRIAFGILLLVTLTITAIYSANDASLKSQAAAHAQKVQAMRGDCAAQSGGQSNGDAFTAAFGNPCAEATEVVDFSPPTMERKIGVWKAAALYGVLPLWIAMHIIDFMFGGAARRKRRHANSA